MQPVLVDDQISKFTAVQKFVLAIVFCIAGWVFASDFLGFLDASPERILEVSKNTCIKQLILTSNSKNGALRIVDIDDFEHDCTLKREFEEQTHLITDKTKGVFSAPEPTPQ